MDLTAIDKVLLADIDSFTGNGKLFYKSNATLSRELGVSESTVKRSVKGLENACLVELSGNTRKRLIRSLMDSVDSGHNGLHSGQNGSDKVQDDPSVGSNRPPIKTTISSVIKSTNYPFEGEEFKDVWAYWLDERKARRYGRYTERGELAALHKLYTESNENLETAIQMINESIANCWRGIFPLKKSNDKGNSNKEFDSKEYRDYLEAFDDGNKPD